MFLDGPSGNGGGKSGKDEKQPSPGQLLWAKISAKLGLGLGKGLGGKAARREEVKSGRQVAAKRLAASLFAPANQRQQAHHSNRSLAARLGLAASPPTSPASAETKKQRARLNSMAASTGQPSRAPPATTKTTTKAATLRRSLSLGGGHQQQRRRQDGAGGRLMKGASRRFKGAVVGGAARLDAWLALGLLLAALTCQLLAPPQGSSFVEAAALPPQLQSLPSLPPPNQLQPIWLGDGQLIPLADEASPQEPPRWLVQMQVLAPEEDEEQLAPGGVGEEATPSDPDQEAAALWLERRRLDRDRAREPAPWLRVQPMRRDGGGGGHAPLASNEEEAEISNARSRSSGGRQSREPQEDAYHELLGQLLAETLGSDQPAGPSGHLLADLYERLQASAASPPTREESPAGAAHSAADSRPLKLRLAQGGSPASADDGSSMLASSMLTDQSASLADSALVVAGDEVSGGDGSSLAQPPPVSPLGQLQLVEPAAGLEEVEQAGDLASSARLPMRSAALVAPAPLVGRLRLPTSNLNDQQQPQDSYMEPPVASFHVLEDIDQAESGQVMQQQQPQQTYPMKRRPQQQQQVEVEDGEQLAIRLIESGVFSERQLGAAATKLKGWLERYLGLPADSILSLYPIGDTALLIQLDQERLSGRQRLVLVENYNYSRGYMIKSWPAGSRQNPLPLFGAILRSLNKHEEAPSDFPSDDYYYTAPTRQVLNAGAPLGASWDELADGDRQTMAAIIGSYWAAKQALAAQQQQQRKLPMERIGAPAKAALISEATGGQQHSRALLHLAAVAGALLIALVAVKLAMWRHHTGRPGGQAWRGGPPSSHSGELSGQAKAAEAGDLPPPAYTEEAAASLGDKWQFGQLTQRLAQLVRRHEAFLAPAKINKKDIATTNSSQELDEASTGDPSEQHLLSSSRSGGALAASDREDCAKDATAIECGDGADDDSDERYTSSGGSRFRSSRSYIRSLIEALTKSRVAQVVGPQPTSASHQQAPLQSQQTQTAPLEQQQQQPGDQVVAQMDISAAHLILDYMEKHLEDKERLAREWQELNVSSAGGGKSASAGKTATSGNNKTGGGIKASGHLQRLARVGLSEENKARNRSQQVVPFDRNRVRLGQRRGGDGGQQQPSPKQQDYINASYIYDDDLRRPTHIIAQGPLDELGAAHFWQMVWEQGVSVVVMLTRLNENSVRMCHCYWPTTTTANNASNLDQQTAIKESEAARRGSVTSVYSGKGNSNGGHDSPPTPIVGPNGELGNNVLSFQLDGLGGDGGEGETMMEVHLVSEHVSSPDFVVRNMYLVNKATGETRTITQFHYLAWPESGVPVNVKSFLEFRRKVHKSYRNLASPILVHCSDGGGRSGTYTLIDIILERIRNGAKEIDPSATLEHLRDQRAGLCSTQSQFEFVLVALAEEIQIILNALPH